MVGCPAGGMSLVTVRDRPKYHYRLDNNSWRLLTKFSFGKSYMGYMILAGWLFWVIKRSQTRSKLRIAVVAELHMLSSFRTPSMLFHVSCLSAGHGCVLGITLSSSEPLVLHHTVSNFNKNHLRNIQYVAPVTLETRHTLCTFFCKLLKHTIKWDVQIIDSNTSQLKLYVKSLKINTSHLESPL